MQAKSISTPHRLGAMLFAVMLFWSAAMQLNDPDPFAWIAMYAVLGAAAAVAALWRVVPALALLLLVVALVWSMTLWPGVFELFVHHPAGDLVTGMSPDRPYVEEAREALGLLIGVLAMGQLLWASRAGTLAP